MIVRRSKGPRSHRSIETATCLQATPTAEGQGDAAAPQRRHIPYRRLGGVAARVFELVLSARSWVFCAPLAR